MMPFWFTLIFLFVLAMIVVPVAYRHDVRSLGRRALPRAHRPDYAEIKRLEIALGMREPDPGPFVRHTQSRLRPKDIPLGEDKPPMFMSIADYDAYLQERFGGGQRDAGS